MLASVTYNEETLGLLLERDSDIQVHQNVDRNTGGQVYLISNLDADDLWLLKQVITKAIGDAV